MKIKSSGKRAANQSGSLAGTPAFLGYLRGVFFIFFISTSILPISLPGRTNLSVLIISPPRIFTAFSACLISSPASPLLYDTKLPFTFINGMQYSLSVDRFATARETHRSNCSLYSAFFAWSSALISAFCSVNRAERS